MSRPPRLARPSANLPAITTQLVMAAKAAIHAFKALPRSTPLATPAITTPPSWRRRANARPSGTAAIHAFAMDQAARALLPSP